MSLKRPVVQPVDNLICSLDHEYCKRRCPVKDNIHYSAASLTSLHQHPGVDDSSDIGFVPMLSASMENIHYNGEVMSLAELVTTSSVEASDCIVYGVEGGSSSKSSVPLPTSVPITTTVASTTGPTTPGTSTATTSSAFVYFGNRRNIRRATDGL